MSDILIAVLNRSTVRTNDQLQPAMAVLQTQIRPDWALVWGGHADQYGYAVDRVTVTDFVYPGWFESFRSPGSMQFDHGKTHHHDVSAAARGLHQCVRRHHWDRLAPTHPPNHFNTARDARPRRQPPRTPPHPA